MSGRPNSSYSQPFKDDNFVPDNSNSAFEIGVHDLELSPQLLKYFNESRPAGLRAFVRWTFLGLSQQTETMPVKKSYFDLKVTYCGPPSISLCNYLKETVVTLELMLEDERGTFNSFGKGKLEVLPALLQPEKRFFRCVPVATSAGGNAFLYCSFRQLNNCCNGPVCPGGIDCLGCSHIDCPRRIKLVKEYLEVKIGRLKLKQLDFPNSSRPPHIYVEYSILGYCGSKFETNSEPKHDLLHFNYSRRISVTKDNAQNLQKMLLKTNPQLLVFTVLTEPCGLSTDTDIQEIGSASVNLRKEMLDQGRDLVSGQLPVLDTSGEVRGTLSVTVLGINTLRRHAPS